MERSWGLVEVDCNGEELGVSVVDHNRNLTLCSKSQ